MASLAVRGLAMLPLRYHQSQVNSLWARQLCVCVCVCACLYICLTEGRRKKGKRYMEKVALCTRVCVHVRGRFSYPQREKSVSYLSLCFKGRGMKAIFKWHLQSRSTWTQSAPVKPKWTTGEFLWWRKLNANHTKCSHSHINQALSCNPG